MMAINWSRVALPLSDLSGDGCYAVLGADPMATPDGPFTVKLGMTGNMRKRMYALQTNAPWPLLAVGWAPCGSRVVASFLEDLLLSRAPERLGATRVSGEWFSVPLIGMAHLHRFLQDMMDLVSYANADAYRDQMMRRRQWRRVGIEQEVGLRGRQWYIARAEGYFDDTFTGGAVAFPLPTCGAIP